MPALGSDFTLIFRFSFTIDLMRYCGKIGLYLCHSEICTDYQNLLAPGEVSHIHAGPKW